MLCCLQGSASVQRVQAEAEEARHELNEMRRVGACAGGWVWHFSPALGARVWHFSPAAATAPAAVLAASWQWFPCHRV
jgi:hypothetical protein